MIKFKIEGKQYQIRDIMSIEDYVKIYKIKDLFDEEYFAAKLVSIVTDAPMEDLLECGYEEVAFLAASILQNLPKKDKVNFQDQFELGGTTYGFLPSWKELTFSEFVDLDTLSTKKADELLDNLHFIAAIMYRPIIRQHTKHKFDIEPYEMDSMIERAELFKKHLDVKILLGSQFFFIKFAKMYSSHSLQYSIPKLSIWTQVKLIWKMWRMIYKIRSLQPLGGFWSSTNLLKTILQNTKKY